MGEERDGGSSVLEGGRPKTRRRVKRAKQSYVFPTGGTVVRSYVYTCAKCRKTFETGWDDSDAVRELKQNFPGAERQDCDVVCDDCYTEIMESLK